MTSRSPQNMTRAAIVLVNLGGPDSPQAVKPFLFNLFNDPAIISLPKPFRYLLARWIAYKRAPIARAIYDHLGGRSPLVPMTEDQAAALDDVLNDDNPDTVFKSFIAMRYWHPMSLETAENIRAFDPDRIIFLPLYPQYSTTTTGSSWKEWLRAARLVDLRAPTSGICCYPGQEGWIAAQSELLLDALRSLQDTAGIRVLFSAHGLPKKIIDKGDPYQYHVELTADAIVQQIKLCGYDDLDWIVCYQSKVGPLAWIGPSTEAEIERAALAGIGVVIVPLAFVSEHSETLVELDIEYRERADELNMKTYLRVPTVGTHPRFIEGLAALVRDRISSIDPALANPCLSAGAARLCPQKQTLCPFGR